MPLRFNVAGYSIDYKDIRPGTGDFNIRTGAGGARTFHASLDLRHVARNGFDLGLFVTNLTNKPYRISNLQVERSGSSSCLSSLQPAVCPPSTVIAAPVIRLA